MVDSVCVSDAFLLSGANEQNRGVVRMDQEKVLNIAKGYADTVRRVLSVKDIYLYGSYARGTANKDSDIDIAVIVDELPEDYLGTLKLLWKLTRCECVDIEPVLLNGREDRSGFLATVLKTGIPL